MSDFSESGVFFTSLKPEIAFSKPQFQNYWNNLSTDQYIEGDNKFRQRKYSRLKYDSRNNTIENIGSIYFQGKEYNNLFGGKHRSF